MSEGNAPQSPLGVQGDGRFDAILRQQVLRQDAHAGADLEDIGALKGADDAARIETVIETLYRYYNEHPELIIREFPDLVEHTDMEELVKDHIAGMTDRYAENTYQNIIK